MIYDMKLLKQQLINSELIIFDFDGTLVDLEHLNYDSLVKVVQRYLNEGVDLDMYRSIAAGTKSILGIQNVFNEISKRSGKDVSQYDYQLLSEEFREYKRAALLSDPDEFSRLVKRADIFIPMMKEMGKRIAMASASSKEFIERLLDHYKLLKYFDHIVADQDVVLPKPSSEPYEKVIDHFNEVRSQVTVFEDSKNGIRSAKGAGLYTVGILCPGWNDEFVYDLADVVIDDYSVCVELMNKDF
jgi:HAD superfamily hydrolase (TIGR01509 family)